MLHLQTLPTELPSIHPGNSRLGSRCAVIRNETKATAGGRVGTAYVNDTNYMRPVSVAEHRRHAPPASFFFNDDSGTDYKPIHLERVIEV